MTDPEDIDFTQDWDPDQAHNQHALLIGEVTIAWNDVHDLVYHTFEDCSGLSDSMAKALFNALRSDAGQRDLTLAAAKVALAGDELRFKALKTIFSTIGNLAAARNEAIHTSWGVELYQNAQGELRVGGIGKRPRHLSDDGKFRERFLDLEVKLLEVFEQLLLWRQQKPFPGKAP